MPDPETPGAAPEPVNPAQPEPDFEPTSPDVDGSDMDPSAPEPGTIADDGLFASASAVGHREPGDVGDIGGTDRMTASTGGLAGTSR